MKLQSLNCPNCGSPLKTQGNMQICESCGSSFKIDYDDSDVAYERLSKEDELAKQRFEHEKEMLETEYRLKEEARIKQQQAAQVQKTAQPQKPANNQPVINQSSLPVSEPRTIQEINEQDKPAQVAAPVQKTEPVKEPPVQKQGEVKTNTAKAIERLKKTSEEPNKAEIKPDKDNTNNSSDKKETPQNQPQNKPDEEKRNHKGILFAIAAAIFTIILFIGGSALLNKNKNDIPEEPVEEETAGPKMSALSRLESIREEDDSDDSANHQLNINADDDLGIELEIVEN